jgi:hypothetical protein
MIVLRSRQVREWQDQRRRRVEFGQVLLNTGDLRSWESSPTDYVLGDFRFETRDRCYDFLNIFAENFGKKLAFLT